MMFCVLFMENFQRTVSINFLWPFPDKDALKTFIQGNTILVKNGESEEAQYIIKELNLFERRMSITLSRGRVEEKSHETMQVKYYTKKGKDQIFFSWD